MSFKNTKYPIGPNVRLSLPSFQTIPNANLAVGTLVVVLVAGHIIALFGHVKEIAHKR